MSGAAPGRPGAATLCTVTSRPHAPQAAAWSLLEYYNRNADMGADELASCLQSALGKMVVAKNSAFAFLLHDRHRHRVVAARNGDIEMFWGCVSTRAVAVKTAALVSGRGTYLNCHSVCSTRQAFGGRRPDVLHHDGLGHRPGQPPDVPRRLRFCLGR